MTTKAPSPVRPATHQGLETIAYASVAGIPTVDPHDRDRLGYNIWVWLKYRRDPLEFAVRTSRARLLVSEEEAVRTIRDHLSQQGVAL
ncbi:MAG: hypothetical protein OEM41_00400 [Ignavibacteria bacterium]|nr:hypothetical protein [Ignavibacteria bacterium]